jgi:hypothetical protein
MKVKEQKVHYGTRRGPPVPRPRGARDLLRVDPKDLRLLNELGFSMAHLTAYSVHWLAAWEIPATYENVSVLNARLFPSKFTLAGYPEFPDAMCTNREILHLRPNNRGFATSDPRKGVFLTEKGREAATKVIEALGIPTFGGKPVSQTAAVEIRPAARGRDRTRNPANIITDCKGKLLYKRYTEGKLQETEIVHFLGLVSLYDHTPPSEIRKAFRQLRADAQTCGDAEFLEFLDRVEARFSQYLNRSDAK